MRPIRWLHISDIHVRVSAAWSQDVVLRAACDFLASQRQNFPLDFILLTGDLAYSGKREEYAIVGTFVDALAGATGVPRSRVFCIPGNHDIDRDRQKVCFRGARELLVSPNQVDDFLGSVEDRQTLLCREENFRRFRDEFFAGQERASTQDGLGYVSRLAIDDIHLAVVALDSAWLADGDFTDRGRLVIGERQLIDALRIVRESGELPHIVVGMAHHPLHLLSEFDRRPVQNRLEEACQFFHCGHLHEPEARAASPSASGCLALAAGASFLTRQSRNSFSLVELDLLQATRSVTIVEYAPNSGRFSGARSASYPFEVAPTGNCSVRELATALTEYDRRLSPFAHYLAALLLGQKAEVPIPTGDVFTFGTVAVLQALAPTTFSTTTSRFIEFRNPLRALYGRLPLADLLGRHGGPVVDYSMILAECSGRDAALRARLGEHERDAASIADGTGPEPFANTSALLEELAAARDWPGLRAHSERLVDSPDRTLRRAATRMLALALGNSNEPTDRATAIDVYQNLLAGDSAITSDCVNLATLLFGDEHLDRAKTVVLEGLARHESLTLEPLIAIGHQVAEATGDRAFRVALDSAAQAGRARV